MSLTNDIIIKAHDRASRKFKAVGQSASGLTSILKKAAAAGAAYMSARAIVNFGKESFKAFQAQEDAVNDLTAALKNLGSAAQSQDMQAFAAQLQQVTTSGDEATMEIMTLGATLGGMSGDTLKAATTAALGLSKSLGVDTKTAMTMVSKAAQGNFTTFSRYGIQLDSTMTAQEKFQAVLARGADDFKLAQAETETTSGKLQQLSNTWGDLKESIGKTIAEAAPAITENFKAMEVAIENWRLVLDMAWTSAKLGLIGFWEDIKHFFGSTIPTLLDWFAENWKDVFKDIFNGYKAYLTNMSKNWVNFMKAMWSWIKGDGFDFQWTGLMDGFESSIKELPNIAKRELTATEQELSKNLDNMRNEFGQLLAGKMSSSVDTQSLVANAAMPGALPSSAEPGKALAGAGSSAGKNGSSGLDESRFLTMRAGSPVSETAKNTRQTAEAVKQLLAVMRQQSQTKAAIFGQSGTAKVSDIV